MCTKFRFWFTIASERFLQLSAIPHKFLCNLS